MNAWNFDIEEAPRGRASTKTVTVKGNEVTQKVFIPSPVILATKCGKVMASEWLPQAERWHGLATGEQPVAWQPWPTHPQDNPSSPTNQGRGGLKPLRFIR